MRALIALIFLMPALAFASPAQTMTPQELRFVTANAEFTLFHEMGHLLINELRLPVLGREEDAADQLGFMGLFLIDERQRETDFPERMLDIADYWRVEWQRPKRPDEEIREWDSHALDAQRFYNIACLAYGSDPVRLEWMIQATGLPDERAFFCPDEYQQARHAVNWFQEHFRRPPEEPVRHRIQVVYDPPPPSLDDGEELLARVRASGELEKVAEKASTSFPLPRDLTLRLTSCGAPDAWYNRISGELTLCYERIAYFRELAARVPRLHPAASSR